MRPRYVETVFKCLVCQQPAIHPMHDRCLLGSARIVSKAERKKHVVAHAITAIAKRGRP